jgi:hypothetical protein
LLLIVLQPRRISIQHIAVLGLAILDVGIFKLAVPDLTISDLSTLKLAISALTVVKAKAMDNASPIQSTEA